MRIRVKVKHLVLYVLLPLSMLTLIFLALPSSAIHKGAAPLSDTPSETARAAFLKTMASGTTSQRVELIQSQVIQSYSNRAYRFDVYIGPGTSQWSQSENEEPSPDLSPEERIKYLKEYVLEGPVDGYLLQAVKQLIYEWDASGSRVEGDRVLIEAAARISSKSSMARELGHLRAERELNAGNLQEAGKLLNQADFSVGYNEVELDAQSATLRARLLLAQGKSREALDLVNRSLKTYREEWKKLEVNPAGEDGNSLTGEAAGTHFPESEEVVSSDTERHLLSLRNALESAVKRGMNSPATVTGTLTRSDGSAVSRAGVFLRAESDINHSVSDYEPYRVVTDQFGHFELRGIIPGFYQIHLGLSFEQIDGWTWPVQGDDWLEIKPGDSLTPNLVLQPLLDLKSPVNSEVLTGPSVDFSWEAVKDAAYYSLSGTVWADTGNSFSTYVREHIPDNEVSIPTDELYNSGGFSTSSSGEGWDSVDPSSLLGFADPNSRFSWSVEAYNAQGEVITRSNGYRLNEETIGNLPFFYLKERDLTAADQLVVDRKLAQALEAYRADYAKDPQDAHALKMLIHLLMAKASYTKDKDLEASTIPLLVQLAQIHPDSNTVYTLAMHYFEQSDWQSYNKYYSLYRKLDDDGPDSYDQSIQATALLYQGSTDEARKLFATVLEQDRSHRFIGSYLAAELIAGEPLPAVLSLAERYPEHSFGHSGSRWPLLISRLQSERAAGPEAFDKQMQEKLGQYQNRDSERLQKWIGDGGQSALRDFMSALLKVG